MLINGLFFYTLVQIAYDRDISRGVTALAALYAHFSRRHSGRRVPDHRLERVSSRPEIPQGHRL
jgi:hypothetical protein